MVTDNDLRCAHCEKTMLEHVRRTDWSPVAWMLHNEQYTTVRGSKVTIYSDMNGERWTMYLPDSEHVDLDATNEYDARREALRIVGP